MLIGYNNDVEHRGMTFHIQTEDRGASDNRIETQLFQGGAILDTKITSYEEIVEGLEGEARNKKIKSVMKASHRSLFKNLLAGKYDEQVGLEPVEKSDEQLRETFKEKVQDFQPGQDRVPQAAVELEEEGIEALEQEAEMEGFEDPADEDHMGLSKLKDRLENIDDDGTDTSEADVEEIDIELGDGDSGTGSASAAGPATESDEPETSIIDPPSDVAELSSPSESSTATAAAPSKSKPKPTPKPASSSKSTRTSDAPEVTADTDKLETVNVSADDLETDRLDTQRLENIEASWSDSDKASRPSDPPEIAATGVTAWTGCPEPDEDLSIVKLVEEQLSN